MEDQNQNRYEILQHLALAGVKGDEVQTAVQAALQQAAGLVGLSAAAVFLWNDQMEVSLSVQVSRDDQAAERLKGLEESMFSSLRRDRSLLSAYMTFGGDTPSHAFTQPLSHRERVFGAVIGLQTGTRTVVQEDLFLEAFSAAVSLNVVASGLSQDGQLDQDRIESERMGAIVETAVTVNHEINNPLTAILGNVQLLLLKHENLDPKVAEKLRVVEQSAMKIRDVTQKLLRITSSKSVEYVDGTNMLKLPDDDDNTADDQSDET